MTEVERIRQALFALGPATWEWAAPWPEGSVPQVWWRFDGLLVAIYLRLPGRSTALYRVDAFRPNGAILWRSPDLTMVEALEWSISAGMRWKAKRERGWDA